MTRSFCAVVHAAIGLLMLLATAPASSSTLATREFRSTTLGRAWSYVVYLPAGYDDSQLSYPVLYLLHGQGGSLNDWATFGHVQRTMDELIERQDVPPAILVMPEGGISWYVDRKENMESALIDDLLVDVQRTFRTVSRRDGRLIAGLSMGGYGALRLALKYPERFAAAGLLSPAIYEIEPPAGSGARRAGVFGAPDFDAAVWRRLNYPALWDDYLARKTPVPMFIASGDDDELYIEMEAAKLYSRLRQSGQPGELRIVNGPHSWVTAEACIPDAFRYLFRHATRPLLNDSQARTGPANKE